MNTPKHRQNSLTRANQDTREKRTETDDKGAKTLGRRAVTEERNQHLSEECKAVQTQEHKCKEKKELLRVFGKAKNKVKHDGKYKSRDKDEWEFLFRGQSGKLDNASIPKRADR